MPTGARSIRFCRLELRKGQLVLGQVTSIFARKVVQQVDASLNKRALLESVGIDLDTSPDPALMVPAEDYYAMLESIAHAESDGHTLPLRVGNAMCCEDYGAFGLAWKTATTLGRSFDRAVRYGRVLTSVTRYELENANTGVWFHLKRDGERTLGLRLSNEASIASAVSIAREVCSIHFHPNAVAFRHDGPSDISAHEANFECPVSFNADRDALLVADEFLHMPNRLGDESISQFFQTHLDTELEKLADDAGLDRRVSNQITQSLSEGIPTLSEVGAKLGMGARTLQRRLSDKGYSFQDLVDSSRRELAEQLLKDSEYSLADVAFLTGFSDQSGFTRAFKRWAGETPRSYRLASQ